MHRPAGMSSESDSDELELESSVSFISNKQRRNEFRISSLNSQFQESNQNSSLALEISENVQGFDSISGTDPIKKEDVILAQNDTDEFRHKTRSPLNDADNWSFNGDTTSYSEKQNYLKADSDFDRGRRSPSMKSPNSGKKDWRKFQMHQGVALPMEELRMAVMQGNVGVVKALLSQGIAVDQILKSGWTALMFASSCGKHEMVQYLLQQGADPNMHKEMFTSLMAACAARQESEESLLKCVNHLLDFGAKVNSCERHRMTALMFACKEGRATIVQRLIQAKADLNKQDNKGWTALCWAATKDYGLVVRNLLDASADPTKMNIHGQRPADIALAAGHVQLADILDRALSRNSTEEVSPESEEKSLLARISNGGVHHLSTHCGEMEMVLSGLELSDLIPIFRANKITLECFLRLSENDLEKIGITALGTRKTLLETIGHIHKQEWKTTSLPNLSGLPFISLPDAVAMVANINKHLRFIHASVGHLRDQIQGLNDGAPVQGESHRWRVLAKFVRAQKPQMPINLLRLPLKTSPYEGPAAHNWIGHGSATFPPFSSVFFHAGSVVRPRGSGGLLAERRLDVLRQSGCCKASPRILELGQEKHTVGTLSQELSVSVKNLSFLSDEVKFFKAHLEKVCNNAEYSSVDSIVVQRDDGRQWQRRLCASLAVATTVATVIYFCKPKIFSSLFSISCPQKIFDDDFLTNI